jgi:opacity protein-like surface antigen
MQRLLVLCLVVVLTPVFAAKAQDQHQNDSPSENVVTYAAPEPAAAPASPQIFTASGAGVGNWEVSLGYQFNDLHLLDAKYDNGSAFYTSGYNVSVTHFWNWFGIEAQTGFGYGNTDATTAPKNLDIKSLFIGAGPHIAIRGSGSRWEPWGHGLVGLEHFRFTQNGGPLGKNSTVGWLVGGGVDYHISNRLAIRGEGDFLGTEFFSTTHRNLEIVAGVVMSF